MCESKERLVESDTKEFDLGCEWNSGAWDVDRAKRCKVFSRWLVPSRRASDLDGLSASQLWENHARKSERQLGFEASNVRGYGFGRYGDVELGVIGILLLQDTMSIRDGRDRWSVKGEKDWAQGGSLGHARSYVREGEIRHRQS